MGPGPEPDPGDDFEERGITAEELAMFDAVMADDTDFEDYFPSGHGATQVMTNGTMYRFTAVRTIIGKLEYRTHVYIFKDLDGSAVLVKVGVIEERSLETSYMGPPSGS